VRNLGVFAEIGRTAAVLTIGLLASCTIGGSVQPGASSAGETWSMYRGDLSRDGHPQSAALDASAAKRLALAWQASMAGAIDGSPAVANGVVVAGSQGGSLAAFNSTTGAIEWEDAGLGPISGSPAIAGGTVVVGTLSGHVRALDLTHGHQLWDWRSHGVSPAIWSSPTVYGGLVLVGIGSQYGDSPLEAGRMAALEVATGREVWEFCVRLSCAPGGGIWSTPAIDAAGRAFVGVGNPEDGVVAFDSMTGKRSWEQSFYADGGRDLDVGASPVLFDKGGREMLAVGSVAGVFKALDAATGAVIWSDDLVSGSPVHGLTASPGYDGTRLFVGSASPPDGMFALGASDGAVLWRLQTDEPVYSSPAVGSGVTVFGSGPVFGNLQTGSIVAVSTTDGQVLWTYSTHSAVRSSPAIAGRLVVAGDANGDLFAFRPA
jgi:polyvinyl alcohol dehydrogenase (cytochrome)